MGSEGTLGVISGAVLKRVRTPCVRLTAFLEAIVAQGRLITLDAALSLARIPEFREPAATLAKKAQLPPLLVGHLGDGNIHYATTASQRRDWDDRVVEEFTERCFDRPGEMSGAFSAEHGVGRSKARVLAKQKDTAQFAAMRRIKSALDPDNPRNLGEMFADD